MRKRLCISVCLLLLLLIPNAIYADSEPNYRLATDADFEFIAWDSPDAYDCGDLGVGYFHYIGQDGAIEIPHMIRGVPVTSYYQMFQNYDGDSLAIKSTNKNVVSVSHMFHGSWLKTLDITKLDTSNVTNANGFLATMYDIECINMTGIDVSNVTNAQTMFSNCMASIIYGLADLSLTSVQNTRAMFYNVDLEGGVIDLSCISMSNVYDCQYMLSGCTSTVGYARTQADADKLNSSYEKPSTLTFIVKNPTHPNKLVLSLPKSIYTVGEALTGTVSLERNNGSTEDVTEDCAWEVIKR